MTAMVCFKAGENMYAIPVTATLGVRLAAGIVQMPSQRPDIVGVLPGSPLLSVISPLDGGGNHILVITTPEGDYGLLVDQVTEVCDVTDDAIRPAPAGQDRTLILGVAELGDDRRLFLADPVAIGRRM